MLKPMLHIAIIESSAVIFEGLQTILFQSEMGCRVYRVETFEEFAEMLEEKNVDILIANPVQFANREKEIRKFRKSHPALSVAGIDMGMAQKQWTSLLDAAFTLYDSPEHIVATLLKLDPKKHAQEQRKQEDDALSERETDVLRGLVNGLSNKEIADSLSISIHTVVSHRKNITLKTGIRSQSGLTIYAISKKIVAIEDIDLAAH